jgi:ParB family chromosome partitioning protein
MGRKNFFGLGEGVDAPGGEGEDVTPLPRGLPTTSIRRGAVGMAANDLLVNSQREIDTNLIDDDDSPRDRLVIDDESIAGLADQIRVHGQLVPILVRQNYERPGRFKIVYGRRRLAALRRLGMPAKVLIRSLTDREAIIAQGQENSARQDPSFIEKALFAKQLRERDYEMSVIQDALVVDSSLIYRMKSVTEAVSLDVIAAIGAAPSVGRRRWEELGARLKDIPPEEVVDACFPEPPPEDSSSDDRFDLALRNLTARGAPPRPPSQSRGTTPLELRLEDGRALARLKTSSRGVTLDCSRKENPEFTAWFEAEGGKILTQAYEAWVKKNGSK